jgi:FMN reductase
MTRFSPLIVGIGGTLRAGSSSESALRVTLAEAERIGATTRLFSGQAIGFPPYDPSQESCRTVALEMIETLRRADGIILATPGYHGSISGLIKNAIDYTEEMRTDARPYFSGRAVGLIVCADGSQAIGSTLATMRAIVHALRGWPTPFSAGIDSTQQPFGPDGSCRHRRIADQLAIIAKEVVEFARRYAADLSFQAPAAAE